MKSEVIINIVIDDSDDLVLNEKNLSLDQATAEKLYLELYKALGKGSLTPQIIPYYPYTYPYYPYYPNTYWYVNCKPCNTNYNLTDSSGSNTNYNLTDSSGSTTTDYSNVKIAGGNT